MRVARDAAKEERSVAVVYRLFERGDDAQVRAICYDTARVGRSMRGFFEDAELVAEALVGGYLRCEAGNFWVAAEVSFPSIEEGHVMPGWIMVRAARGGVS
jgi:hypothetical protein